MDYDGISYRGSPHLIQGGRAFQTRSGAQVYFLTDGEFEPVLIDRLDAWNRDRDVLIYTIAYFDESGAGLLERIAREHGGKFRFVSESDLP